MRILKIDSVPDHVITYSTLAPVRKQATEFCIPYTVIYWELISKHQLVAHYKSQQRKLI